MQSGEGVEASSQSSESCVFVPLLGTSFAGFNSGMLRIRTLSDNVRKRIFSHSPCSFLGCCVNKKVLSLSLSLSLSLLFVGTIPISIIDVAFLKIFS